MMILVPALTSGSGWVSSISTVTASGTSTPASPDSSATPLAAADAKPTPSTQPQKINCKYTGEVLPTKASTSPEVQRHSNSETSY